MKKLRVFMDTSNVKQLRVFSEKLGVVNDDHSFDEFLHFLNELVGKTKHQQSS